MTECQLRQELDMCVIRQRTYIPETRSEASEPGGLNTQGYEFGGRFKEFPAK